jgi:CRISPR/Cas system-associated protein Csx1
VVKGKKISDISHLKLDSVKEREDEKFTTREVFSNDFIKEKTSEHLINIQVNNKQDTNEGQVKIESSQNKASKDKNLKAQSKFAQAMEEKNYVNPWMQKKFLMINLSPKNDDTIKPQK